ncbi:MAG: GAF domain-containing protein [Gammaproteobacteria bacterium]|jgi:adenylate cyclase|nr:GAF domain-containing protein [Gammaproteobacteria bacterium]
MSEATALGVGIEGLIKRLVHTASNLMNADRASLFLIDPVTGELWSKVAEGADVKEIRIPAGAGVAGWAAQRREMVNIQDAYEDERFSQAVDKKTGYRTRTILCGPVSSLDGATTIGVVQVINKRTGVFTKDDEALFRAFSHQAAVAVENFSLYRKMVASHERMSILLDIATSISQTLDLGTLISRTVGLLTELIRCERSSFFVLDEERGELWSMEAHGSTPKRSGSRPVPGWPATRQPAARS